MTTALKTTAREHLRDGAGANTHFCFTPSVYAVDGVPNPHIIAMIKDLGVGFIRERWWPQNKAQQKAFASLAEAGVGFYLFVGDIGATVAEVRAEVALLAQSPIASSVIAVCGANEPNSHGGSSWPGHVTDLQQAIYTEVFNQPALADHVAVVGPSLKHNVPNVDADYQAVKAAGIQRWCDVGDFHFYPGNTGPILNEEEAERAGQAYGEMSLWHSETGWTEADTNRDMSGRFSVETYLRNHLTGIVGTIIYGLADEGEYVEGREGMFGMMEAVKAKPAYEKVRTLLATKDGAQEFPGSLGDTASGVPTDTEAVVTSEGNDKWTVYLLKQKQANATLILPSNLSADTGTLSRGAGGNKRYGIKLSQTMTVVQVSG